MNILVSSADEAQGYYTKTDDVWNCWEMGKDFSLYSTSDCLDMDQLGAETPSAPDRDFQQKQSIIKVWIH
jgi:hypothetical protein